LLKKRTKTANQLLSENHFLFLVLLGLGEIGDFLNEPLELVTKRLAILLKVRRYSSYVFKQVTFVEEDKTELITSS
jgi:hypothetical protein